jgi:hypothetical protein
MVSNYTFAFFFFFLYKTEKIIYDQCLQKCIGKQFLQYLNLKCYGLLFSDHKYHQCPF